MMVIGPTAGEDFLTYMGVPFDYPQRAELANHLDDAIWEAANDVLDERKRHDPLLRALADERATMWTWENIPAGDLPVGTRIRAGYGGSSRYRGVLRPATDHEQEWYPGQLGVKWSTRTDAEGAWFPPKIKADTVVEAFVPVPFDLSALLEG